MTEHPRDEKDKYSAESLKGIRERLRAGKLSDEDVEILESLTLRAEEAAKASSVAGRPIVARLPFGMDVIK